MEPVPWLPAAANALVADAVSALEGALGMELVSASLVGAAMNPSRADRARAPEILVVVAHGDRIHLPELSRSLAPVMSRNARIRVITKRELERSLDVFALEIADWKARHRVLSGVDLLGEVEIARKDLRHAIETELRGLVRRLRNRLLAGLAAHRDDPTDAILAGYDRVIVSAFHALTLAREEAPASETAVLERIGAIAGVRADDFSATLSTIRRAEARVDPVKAFDVLLGFTEKLIEWVDHVEVGA